MREILRTFHVFSTIFPVLWCICGLLSHLCGLNTFLCGLVCHFCGLVVKKCGLLQKKCGLVVKMCGLVKKNCGLVMFLCGLVSKMCGLVMFLCGLVSYVSNVSLCICVLLSQLYHYCLCRMYRVIYVSLCQLCIVCNCVSYIMCVVVVVIKNVFSCNTLFLFISFVMWVSVMWFVRSEWLTVPFQWYAACYFLCFRFLPLWRHDLSFVTTPFYCFSRCMLHCSICCICHDWFIFIVSYNVPRNSYVCNKSCGISS